MNILRFIIPISCFKVTFVFLESQISGLHKDNYSTPIEGDVCQRINTLFDYANSKKITKTDLGCIFFYLFFFFFCKLSYNVPSHMRLFILLKLQF